MSVVDGLARVLHADGTATYLPDGSAYPDGVVGVYLDGMPQTTGEAIVLTAYPGNAPDSRNGWTYPRVQVRVRAADMTTAGELDGAVYASLQALGPITLADPEQTELQDCHALQSAPQPMGQDANGMQETTRNYQLTLS